MKFTADQTSQWIGLRLEFLGINQEQLGKKAGIAESEISRYKAQKARPRVELLDRMADALEIDIISLLIALGAIDADAKTTPKIIEGKKNSKVIWQLNQ
jgi:transcriptional regulator with XRE-family HTH domain